MSKEHDMRQRFQFATGTFCLLLPLALFFYAMQKLYSTPYLCAMVGFWLALAEYALARAWWVDVCELRRSRH